MLPTTLKKGQEIIPRRIKIVKPHLKARAGEPKPPRVGEFFEPLLKMAKGRRQLSRPFQGFGPPAYLRGRRQHGQTRIGHEDERVFVQALSQVYPHCGPCQPTR